MGIGAKERREGESSDEVGCVSMRDGGGAVHEAMVAERVEVEDSCLPRTEQRGYVSYPLQLFI